MVGFSFTLYPLFAKALMDSLALILTPVFVLAVTVVLAFFPVSLSTPRYTLARYTIVPFFFLYSVIFMVFTPFPSAGKQLEKILSLYHARDYENPFISDFKQSDGK